jgi:hypothetical protein
MWWSKAISGSNRARRLKAETHLVLYHDSTPCFAMRGSSSGFFLSPQERVYCGDTRKVIGIVGNDAQSVRQRYRGDLRIRIIELGQDSRP